jgi:hypothetical protein
MAALVFLLFLFASETSGQTMDDQLGRIRSHVSVEPIFGNVTQIAGVYRNPPEEIGRMAESSGIATALYLFPDGSYLYLQTVSFAPPTIFDKGTWKANADVVELKSDMEVTWNPDLERRFLILRRTSHRDEALLVGVDVAVRRFERLAGNDAEHAFLLVAKERTHPMEQGRAAKVKDYLMRKAWHPETLGGSRARTFRRSLFDQSLD